MDKLEWLKNELTEIKKDDKNKNKGLIPRFHTVISDRFYGGTKESLSKFCQDLAENNVLFKGFIRYNPGKSDVIEDGVITSGRNKGLKVGKDGKIGTPIYWLKDDPEIPRFFLENAQRAESYRQGQKEFADEPIM